MPQNLMILFKSADNGVTWNYLTDLFPFYWGSLFVHHNKLYVLGLTTEYGDLQIACSENGGEDWSSPVTLFRGSNFRCQMGGMHRAPMTVINYNGRLWTSAEYGSWAMGGHLPMVLSIKENDDLLIPENWCMSEPLKFEGDWLAESRRRSGASVLDITIDSDGNILGEKRGDSIEGNIVVGKDGNIYNIMRYFPNEALYLKVDEKDPEKKLKFDGILPFDMGHSKFQISQHESGIYYAVGNRLPKRNIVSLYKSDDLKNWVFVKDILDYKDYDLTKVGFQYPYFIFDGDEILLLLRTAFNNADTFHNTNYTIFIRCSINQASV